MKTQYAGKCKVDPSHTWKVGDEIHYQADPKCVCSSKECFDKQVAAGGPDKLPKPGLNGGTQRDSTKRVEDARCMLETLWPIALKKATEFYPDIKVPEGGASTISYQNDNNNNLKNRHILAQTFLKAMVEEYVR